MAARHGLDDVSADVTDAVGTGSPDDTQSLRVCMGNLRRKLREDPAQPRYIITEIGVGYRLADS